MRFEGDIDRLSRLAMRLTAHNCVRKALEAYEDGDDEGVEFALFDYDLDTYTMLRRELTPTRL